MKKLAILVGALALTTTTYAQEEKQYTPVSGDWAIGIDATPFLNYVGNLIGGVDANTAPAWNFLTTNQTITGKYFTADDMAYRGSLRIGFGAFTERAMIGDDAVTTAPVYPALPSNLEDSHKMGTTNFGLSGGIEWRKGKGRLVGFYGAELGFMMSSSKDTYTYGNAIVAANGMASTTDFGANVTGLTDASGAGNPARINEVKSGSTIGFGLRGFIGAEYFVLPKMSLGGEFGWGLGMLNTGASTTTMESTDGAQVASQEVIGTKTSSFGIDTDMNNSVFGPAGSLRLTFHF